MKNWYVRLALVSVLFCAYRPVFAGAQESVTPTGPVWSEDKIAVLTDVEDIGRKLIQLAQAMPSDKFSWRPTAGSAYSASKMPEGVQVRNSDAGATVLADAKGMTLYAYDKDTVGKSNCAGKCLMNWPALVAAGNAAEMGDWTVVTRDDGSKQWAYKGKPLYTFVKDMKPGDTTGDGVGMVWYKALPGETFFSVSEVYVLAATRYYHMPSVWGGLQAKGYEIEGNAATAGTTEDPPLEKTTTHKGDTTNQLVDAVSYFNGMMKMLSDSDMQKPVKILGRTTTPYQSLILMDGDLHEFLALAMNYARSNGVVLPWMDEIQEQQRQRGLRTPIK